MSKTPQAATAVALSAFNVRNPDWTILAEARDGDRVLDVVVRRAIANRSHPVDACECALARAGRDEMDVIDVFALKHVLYALEDVGDGAAQMVKYQHTGSGVVETIDSGERMLVDAIVRVSPPAPSRRVGAQSEGWKNRPERKLRGKQSAAHIAKRRDAIVNSASFRRIRNAAMLAASSR